nr:hypothetical protein OG781_09305 [Streptomyces sp. NBC_00830]
MTDVGPEAGERIERTATEFILRMLTDPQRPFPVPADLRAHWFESYGSCAQQSRQDAV